MCGLENFYCLSCSDSRYNFLCQNFKRCNLPIPNRYLGIKNNAKKERCCLFGHMSLIMMARYLNLPYIWIFEEDSYPRYDCRDLLQEYLNNLPDNTGIFIAGRNGWKGNVREVNNSYVNIIDGHVFGAHSYMVRKECYNDVLKAMEERRIADIALSLEYYKDYIPYHSKDVLFVQYNIDTDCMDRRITNEYKCFYPNSNGSIKLLRDLPSEFIRSLS